MCEKAADRIERLEDLVKAVEAENDMLRARLATFWRAVPDEDAEQLKQAFDRIEKLEAELEAIRRENSNLRNRAALKGEER